MNTYTRSAKHLGDFGEGLVTYVLIRKGYEVADVDHVGADLIAEKKGHRIAISVKTRLFRPGSKESRMVVIEDSNLRKLDAFASRFGMEPVFAEVVCMADAKAIHIFILRLIDIPKALKKVKFGYSLRFGAKAIHELETSRYVDYSYWKDEHIGTYDFHVDKDG